jgi:dihydrolipoamide dehydrogenase
MGTEVTIVEFMPNIVPVEDEDISKQMDSMKKAENHDKLFCREN